jgi:hypothetical protein
MPSTVATMMISPPASNLQLGVVLLGDDSGVRSGLASSHISCVLGEIGKSSVSSGVVIVEHLVSVSDLGQETDGGVALDVKLRAHISGSAAFNFHEVHLATLGS